MESPEKKIFLNKTWIVIALLGIFLFLSVSSILVKSITNDELVHIPAGYSYWKTGDFRMNKEHPPLVKLLAGIPLLGLQPELGTDDETWIQGKEWNHGARFFYHFGNDADQIVLLSRIPIILLGVLLGFYVFRWAKELYGDTAGLMALFLYVLSPNILAQTRFVTTDLGIAAFAFITSYYFWKFCQKRTLRNLLFTGAFFGCTLSAKFTGIYMFGILTILGALWVWINHRNKKLMDLIVAKDTKEAIIWLCAIFGIGIFVLAATYFFVNIGSYFKGLLTVIAHSQRGHRAFLLGMHSEQGWWYYFFVAYFIKTPLALTAMLLLSLGLYKKSKYSKHDLFLIVPMIVFFMSFVFNNINIGVRHILPVYPFLFVFVSRLVTVHVSWKKILHVLVGILLVSFAVSSFMIYPHYLNYFNVAVGGPTQGHHYLGDSNVDWGQDLKGLKKWMDENDVQHLKMSYFGKDSRGYRDISWEELKCGPQTGMIAIGVSRLAGFTAKDSACTAWLLEHEPIARIGYSINVYNIQEDSIVSQRELFCTEKCENKCDAELLQYGESFWNGSCICRCSSY